MKEILVIEDEKDIQNIIKAFLENAGYKVETADDGLDGINIIQKNKFDLVLLDIMMPKIDGFVVCEMIRKNSNVPIIILYVDNYLEEKLEIDKKCIVCKYYDLKVIKDLSDKQVDDLLRIAREKLLKKGYEVYFTGAKFIYQNANRTVQDNEFMIAIKEEGDC